MKSPYIAQRHEAWNKGKLVGQKAPFKLKEIWAIRIRLQMQGRLRELALFGLGVDSKLRACDLVKLRVRDVCHGDRVAARAIVLQRDTWTRSSMGPSLATLPIETVSRHELVINLKTAQKIGVTLSSEVPKQADRVIQ